SRRIHAIVRSRSRLRAFPEDRRHDRFPPRARPADAVPALRRPGGRGRHARAAAGPGRRRRRMHGSRRRRARGAGSRARREARRHRRAQAGGGADAGPPDRARAQRRQQRHRQRARAAVAQLPAWHVPLRRLLRRLRRVPEPIDPALWREATAPLPWLRGLPPGADDALAALAARFLQRKAITPLGGLALGDADRVRLAALCCLPLLGFGAEGLHGWSQLLVYPDAFRVDRSHVDAAGVMHEWDDELIGEAWDAGPLVLSWADVQADIADPWSGFCVAVHEMAHKLDALDGVLDGT